jgi:hypothetical protein
MTLVSLRSYLLAATAGPLLEAEMIPLYDRGKLRVTYNWLYSALNCAPDDASRFVWVLNKLDETHVALSPKEPYRNMQLYASVRDDWSWYVQVQAAHSADWIRKVGRNETLTLEPLSGLFIVSFKGFNNQYIALDADISRHDDHSGYRVRSIGTGDVKARSWFLGVTQVLQKGPTLPLAHEVTQEDILREMLAAGLPAGKEEISRIHSRLST